MEGFSPETISATSLPVSGPRLRPIIAWPVARMRFAKPDARLGKDGTNARQFARTGQGETIAFARLHGEVEANGAGGCR